MRRSVVRVKNDVLRNTVVFRITHCYMKVTKQTQVLTIGQTPRVACLGHSPPQESVRRSKPIPSPLPIAKVNVNQVCAQPRRKVLLQVLPVQIHSQG